MPTTLMLDAQASVSLLGLEILPKTSCAPSAFTQILKTLQSLEDNPEVKALVLTGFVNWSLFDGDEAKTAQSLRELCNRIELFPKPVIACLKGNIQGQALELALAAHWRLAAEDASFTSPEISLGFVPCAGGALRLPRLVGAKAALQVMILGEAVSSRKAAQLGLLDQVVKDDVTAASIAFAENAKVRPTRDLNQGLLDPAGYLQTIRTWREAFQSDDSSAEARIVDCVEAAILLPFSEAQAFESVAYGECLAAPKSRALRHMARAEQRAMFPTLAHQIRRVSIIGGGVTGTALAIRCLMAGLPVELAERDGDLRDNAAIQIEAVIMANLKKDRIGEDQALDALTQFEVSKGENGFASCDIVIEALPNDLMQKKDFFHAVEAALPQAVIFASATSYGDISGLAQGTKHPERVIGLKLSQSGDGSRLLEILPGPKTDAEIVAQVFGFAKQADIVAVCTNGVSISDRVLQAYRQAMDHLCELGASPEQIDTAIRDAGFLLGPYQQTSLQGREPPPMVLRQGQMPHPVSPEQIRRRAFAAMANEGARLVDEGIAQCPSDIDVVMVHGHGFPRALGGPMHWADEAGLILVRDDIRRWGEDQPEFWELAPLWAELIKMGGRFGSLGDDA